MAGRILHRKKAHREWMLRNLATSVILYERVQTTQAKAKEVCAWVDRAINLGKKDSLEARRQLLGWLPDPKATKKVWEVLRSRYHGRTGGYTQLVRLGNRPGDNAPLTLIELLPAAAVVSPTASTELSVAAAPMTEPKKKIQLRKPKATVTVRRKGGTR